MPIGISKIGLFKPGLCAAAALAVWASTVVSTAASTIAVSGVLNAVADAQVTGADPARDLQRERWTGTPQTLTTNVFARSTSGPESVTASGQAAATWNSADSGTVSFRDYGWHFMTSQHGATADLSHKLEADDWSYTFMARQDGVFTMNWDIRLASGNGHGLRGWKIDWTGSGSGYTNPNVFDPTESGVFVGVVHAGTQYTIALQEAGGPFLLLGGDPSARDYSGYMDGNFTWSISSEVAPAVPEPATWAMMILGFLGLGSMTRLRNKRAPRFA